MLTKKPDAHSCLKSRNNGMNIKIAIKEKKADKRKEKSRVAAQIRRNKESQTLILLQNALPIGLPSPNQMLEKSIVIRIAGQTLFLLKSLDQVLGMCDWLTVPLISSNFLAFFTDNIGQIVYASPNIQTVLEQHHWSNLIGISIFDIMDFKSRWPVTGDVVKLKFLTNPNPNSDYKPNKPQVNSMSFSPSLSYPNYSRSTVASKLNLRTSPSMINQYKPNCSIYTVWSSTNISHTNSKLRLLILRQVQLQTGSIMSPTDTPKPIFFPNSDNSSLDRSFSWPLCINQIKSEKESEAQTIKDSNIQKGFLVSIHDKKYNFEAINSEFCNCIGHSENDLIDQNLLDIIHIEDVNRVKSYLDSIVEKRDNNVWTPIYRITCNDGRYCMIKTLAKQYSSNCSQSIVLHHKIIRTGLNCEYSTKHGLYEHKQKSFVAQKIISTNSPIKKSKNIQKSTPYFMSQNSTRPLFQKRKPSENESFNEIFSQLTENDNSNYHKINKESFSEKKRNFENLKPQILNTNKDIKHSILEKDPFLTTCFERRLIINQKSKPEFKTNRSKSICMNQFKSMLKDRFENESNCSASHSMESCVLTSPSPESVGIANDEQFLWDEPNQWLDYPYQTDLELILPI